MTTQAGVQFLVATGDAPRSYTHIYNAVSRLQAQGFSTNHSQVDVFSILTCQMGIETANGQIVDSFMPQRDMRRETVEKFLELIADHLRPFTYELEFLGHEVFKLSLLSRAGAVAEVLLTFCEETVYLDATDGVLSKYTLEATLIAIKEGDTTYSDILEFFTHGALNNYAGRVNVSEYLRSKESENPTYRVRFNQMYENHMKQEHTVTVDRRTSDFDYILAELYPSIDMDMFVDAFNDSKETLLLMSGLPGTGKTTLLKKILAVLAMRTRSHINTLYIKDQELLKKESVWAKIQEYSEHNIKAIILDDLDHCLYPRKKGEDNSIVNRLLSFTDGVFDNKTKVIITTNVAGDAIDPALVRPGRCFEFLNLGPLTRQQAMDIWINKLGHTEEQFVNSFSELQDIPQALIMAEHSFVEKMGANRPYLRDESVSVIRQKILEGRNAGLI